MNVPLVDWRSCTRNRSPCRWITRWFRLTVGESITTSLSGDFPIFRLESVMGNDFPTPSVLTRTRLNSWNPRRSVCARRPRTVCAGMVAEEPVVIAGRPPLYGVRHATKAPARRAAASAHTLAHNGWGAGVVLRSLRLRSHTWRVENGGDRSRWWAEHGVRWRGTRHSCPTPAARRSCSEWP